MNGSLILFGIEAGVRLGRKVYDVLVDQNVERALLLPIGDLYADVTRAVALNYFLEHPALTARGNAETPRGPYFGYNQGQLILAYKTLIEIDSQLKEGDGSLSEAVDVIGNLSQFEQYKEGFGSKPVLQRLLGTLVEIGVDYFLANPKAMGRDSNARRVVQSFLIGLDETDFAESSRIEIVGDLLGASLRALDSNLALIDDSRQVQAVLGGITKALLADIEDLTASGALQSELADREALIRRLGSSVIRGAVGAFSENLDLFMEDGTSRKIAQSALTQVLKGISGKEDIFSNETIRLIYKSALVAIADNTSDLIGDEFVGILIADSLQALSDADNLFAKETFGAIVLAALETLRDNAELLINPDDPREQLFATTISAMAKGLVGTLAGGGGVNDLLSKTQLLELAQVVFQQVAAHPEHLIGADPDDARMTALAQILGSVAQALGTNPGLLVSGDGLVSLLDTAIEVAVLNADKLIDFGDPNTAGNLLFKIVQQVAMVIEDESKDPRGLVTRQVFLEIVERVLPLTSANLEILIAGKENSVRDVVQKTLELAEGILENRTNGATLPVLVEELLRRVLWGELDLDAPDEVTLAAREILRRAS